MANLTSYVTDTQLDPPSFVSLEEHYAVLQSARVAVRERDRLALEAVRLRRDGGQVQQLRRELDEARARATRGGAGTRELAEMREAVEARDREIRRLKDGNVARERLLADASDRLAVLMHERQSLEGRLTTRDKALTDLEARLAAANSDLTLERKRADEFKDALARVSAELAQRDRDLKAEREAFAVQVQKFEERLGQAIAQERAEHIAELRDLEARHSAEREQSEAMLRAQAEAYADELTTVRLQADQSLEYVMQEMETANGELVRQLEVEHFERNTQSHRRVAEISTATARTQDEIAGTF